MKKVLRFLFFGFVVAAVSIVAKAIFSRTSREEHKEPEQSREDPYAHHSFFDEGAIPKDR